MDDAARLPLSVLVDRLAGEEGARDEQFVRAFSAWMVGKAGHLRLDIVEALRLRDVVVTFRMKSRVRLIVTGYPPEDLPGEVTVVVDERDFTHVHVALRPEPFDDPYEICTMDYSLAGRRVRVTEGDLEGRAGTLVVAATVGHDQQNRVQLDDGPVVTLAGEVLSFEP